MLAIIISCRLSMFVQIAVLYTDKRTVNIGHSAVLYMDNEWSTSVTTPYFSRTTNGQHWSQRRTFHGQTNGKHRSQRRTSHGQRIAIIGHRTVLFTDKRTVNIDHSAVLSADKRMANISHNAIGQIVFIAICVIYTYYICK